MAQHAQHAQHRTMYSSTMQHGTAQTSPAQHSIHSTAQRNTWGHTCDDVRHVRVQVFQQVQHAPSEPKGIVIPIQHPLVLATIHCLHAAPKIPFSMSKVHCYYPSPPTQFNLPITLSKKGIAPAPDFEKPTTNRDLVYCLLLNSTSATAQQTSKHALLALEPGVGNCTSSAAGSMSRSCH